MTRKNRTQPEPTQPEPTQPEPTQPEPTQPEPTQPETIDEWNARNYPEDEGEYAPDVSTLDVDDLTEHGQTAMIGSVGMIVRVQNMKASSVLLTSIPQVDGWGGVRGMLGTVGNGTDGTDYIGCAGHGKNRQPTLTWTRPTFTAEGAESGEGWYAFVGRVPTRTYGEIDRVGRECATCYRAVNADGTLPRRVDPEREIIG